MVWQPRRYELLKKPDSEKVFGRIFTYYMLLLFFCGMGVAVLTKDVLKIMANESFWSAYQVVPIIVLANIIFNSSAQINMGLLITKKTKYFALINGTNALLVLCLKFCIDQGLRGLWRRSGDTDRIRIQDLPHLLFQQQVL